MKIYVGVTDQDWYDYLRSQPDIDEVNFWQATINLPVIKDHMISGMTGALKNIAFGCFHTIPQCHDDHCDLLIAEAGEHFLTVNPMPLIILDASGGVL